MESKFIRLWLASAVVLVSVVACGGNTGGGGEAATEEPAAIEDTASEDTGSSDSDNVGDITGAWNIAGSNPDGSEYSGTLEIGTDGDVNVLTWVINETTVIGTGLVHNEAGLLAAVYPREQCYLTIYGVQDDAHALDGIWVAPNDTSIATETGAYNEASSSEGVLAYDVQGTNPDGSTYTGTMSLTLTEDVFSVEENVGGAVLVGTGLEIDEWFIVGFGAEGSDCAVIVYRTGGDTLEGIWAQLSVASTFGSETATR